MRMNYRRLRRWVYLHCYYQWTRRPWPRHLPTPTGRMIMNYRRATNPVTKSSYAAILRNRWTRWKAKHF